MCERVVRRGGFGPRQNMRPESFSRRNADKTENLMNFEPEQLKCYSAPTLAELAIRVEQGFAASVEADLIDPWEEGDTY